MMVLIRFGRRNPEYIANGIRKMISFKLGKEIKKDVFFVLSQVWHKENVSSINC